MKYINIHGLPEIFERWLTHDEYDYHPGIFSATRLLKPTRMVVLEKRHEDELESDISDLIAAQYGTALHQSFEKIEFPDCIQEKRFFAEVDGYKVSGKPDLLQIADGIFKLGDLKSTSVWAVVFNDKEEDYIKQLSIYRWLIMNGECEEYLGDVPTLVSRDGTIYFMFTATDDTEFYIKGRLGAIHHYLENPSESLPRCTRKELWQKPWIMKKGRKTPVKKFQDEDDAHNFLDQMDELTHYLEWSPVQRCNYCSVTRWCDQFKEMDADGIIAEG